MCIDLYSYADWSEEDIVNREPDEKSSVLEDLEEMELMAFEELQRRAEERRK